MLAKATVETTNAKRYLGQFAKHFAHKLPVELAEDSSIATVVFGVGSCVMRADADRLALALEGSDDTMETLKDVVARHLLRFAFRENLTLDWLPV